MAQTPSIPQALHTDVITWWLAGLSPRKISDRLLEEYSVVTSHTSVLRVVDHVADGHADEALLATVTRLRLRSTALLDQLEENLSVVRAEAGLEEPAAQTPRTGPLNLRLFDLADRITIRHLRLAGVGGRISERLAEKYEAQQRRLGDARCAMWGVTWPFQQPSGDAAPETIPAAPPPPPVAEPAKASRRKPESTLPAPSSDLPEEPRVSPPPEPVPPGTKPSSAADSVRMAAKPAALVAEIDASASDRRTLASTPLDAIPPNLAPRRPCPCGSGLRFKHCHGKLKPPTVGQGIGSLARPP